MTNGVLIAHILKDNDNDSGKFLICLTRNRKREIIIHSLNDKNEENTGKNKKKFKKIYNKIAEKKTPYS